jgi:hypothetical protein
LFCRDGLIFHIFYSYSGYINLSISKGARQDYQKAGL